ncbi:MAG TPA: hypothetical protein PLY23_09180, partial [Alphaproteobacteria bacterium]|nr:hypothetical protein [Alphaproteobacteria bacterium]
FFTPTWQSDLSASSHRFERVMTEIESLKYAKSMWESTPEKRTFPVSKEDLEMRPRPNSASEQEMGNYFWALTEPPLEPETEAARAAEIRILEAQERVAQAQFDHEEASSTMEQLGAREELRDALDDLTRSRGDHFFVNPSESLLATRRAFEERNKPLASSLRQDIQETETFYKQNPHIQMTSEVKQHLFDLHETLEFVESAHTYIPVNVGQGIGTGIMVGTMVMPLGKGISEGSRQAAKAFSTASRGVKAAETKLARLSHYLKTRTGKATLLKDASGETQGAISHFDKVIQDLKTQFVQGAERKGIVDALGLEMGGLSRIKIETTRLQQGPPFYSKSYVDKHLKALRAESAADMTLERAGYKLYDAKLPGNKGFDNVAIKFGRQGEIEDILIGESKFVSKGKARLSKLKPIETPMGEVIPVVQMDDTWIERNIADMRKSTHPEIKELGNVLKENERLIRRKVSVTNPQSITQWGEKLHGVELPESQKFIDELARRANVQDD